MKNILVLLLLSVSLFAEEGKLIDSKVISATVFTDHALVTREGEVTLPAGIHELIFPDITAEIEERSVRVAAEGTGMVKVLDVKVKKRFTAEVREVKIKLLQNKIDSLENIKGEIDDRISILIQKKKFIESLQAASAEKSSREILIKETSAKDWDNMLGFVEKNLTEIFGGIRNERIKAKKIEKELEAVQSTMKLEQSTVGKDFYEIIVLLENERKGNIELRPSYIVNNASWHPVYDGRVSTSDKKIELTYFAMARQTTGEDWKDIQLSFSTAKPMSVTSLPYLNPWYLAKEFINPSTPDNTNAIESSYTLQYSTMRKSPPNKGLIAGNVVDALTLEPLIGANIIVVGSTRGAASDIEGNFSLSYLPAGKYHVRVTYVGFKSLDLMVEVIENLSAEIHIRLGKSGQFLYEIMETEPVASGMVRGGRTDEVYYIEPKYSKVNRSELATTFNLPSLTSLPTAYNTHKITMAKELIDIDFEYTSIPKIAPGVYLKGTAVNQTGYPLLEGEMNLFVDNEYINKTVITTIVPSDSLELALGVDQNIQAEKVLINKFNESAGFLDGNVSIIYEYEIRIKNRRSTEVEVIVFDQLPIPQTDEIDLTLYEPAKDIRSLNKERELKWELKLKPGEGKIIPLKFKVSFPENITVYGLE